MREAVNIGEGWREREREGSCGLLRDGLNS